MPKVFLFVESELDSAWRELKTLSGTAGATQRGGSCNLEMCTVRWATFIGRSNGFTDFSQITPQFGAVIQAVLPTESRSSKKKPVAEGFGSSIQRKEFTLAVKHVLSRSDRLLKRPLFTAGKKATRTGIEPATSGSTVRGSNQLSYRAKGWREKYIDTPDTRKAFPRLVFPTDFAKGWGLTIATVSSAIFALNNET